MSSPVIRVLHIEDDPIQHVMIRQLLDKVDDYRFDVSVATGEEEALAAFDPGMELVVLDYHLTNGNGLSCLRRIKKVRADVPVVVVSGVASPQVAAELLEAGADDFYGKEWLDPRGFAAGVRQALARASARKWAGQLDRSSTEFQQKLRPLLRDFLAMFAEEFAGRLSEVESVARQAGVAVSPIILERLFLEVANEPELAGKDAEKLLRLRPLFLEFAARLYGRIDR